MASRLCYMCWIVWAVTWVSAASLLNAFNPSLVVLGGVLSLAGPYILPRVQREADARALTVARIGVTITLSTFRFDACVMGSVSLILREILSNPMAWQPGAARNASREFARSVL